MESTNHDEARIRDYLLGRLTDEEQQEIEERLMVEDGLFDELEVSKCELIEEYCANELPRSERQWFKQHYLASAEGRQGHVFALALDLVKPPVPAPQKLSWFERLQGFLTVHRWALAASASAALVILVAAPFIFRPTPSASYAFTLTSTLGRRSSDDARYFKIPLSPDTGELRLTLLLPEGVTRGTDYRIELDDRSKTTSLKATSQDANSVLVVIPAPSLREGLYALRLYALNPDGTEQLIPGEYLFELMSPARLTAPNPEQSTR